MKKFLSSTKVGAIFLLLTIVWFCFSVYMIVRPISYGMNYHHLSVYEDEVFEGAMKFYSDRTMVIRNTNFDEEIKQRYHYKDGYVFFIMTETEEEYQKEVEYIENNFEEAVNRLFYSAKTSAFKQIVSGGDDGYTVVYTCHNAKDLALACGIIELILIGFTCASAIIRKKQ